MSLIKISFIVGFGGFLGSILRLQTNLFLTKLIPSDIPYGTLIANLVGCFIIGLAMPFFLNNIANEELRFFVVVGVLGSLTTFSSFSFESLTLLKDDFIRGISYISLTLLGCMILTYIGYKLSGRLITLFT